MNKKNNICINCDMKGHERKTCPEPIISFGIILVQIDDSNYEMLLNDKNKTIGFQELFINNNNDIKTLNNCKDSIKFLMIQRKQTLGYIEFIRGRYAVDNIDGLSFLFSQMTQKEINSIGKKSFDTLWDEFWNDKNKKNILENEYSASKNKFSALSENNLYNIVYYTKNIKPVWKESEWGFPKGRKNKNEDKMDCAIREFQEETGFAMKDFHVIKKYHPITEEFTGTNGIRYKHVYYIAIPRNDKIPCIEYDNYIQNNEVGEIEYQTYYEACDKIRPYHKDRKNILTKLYNYIVNKIICT